MELFGDLANETAAQNLNDEKAFVDYAKKVGAVINQAALKRHIQEFIKQLVEEVYPKLTSAEFQVDINTLWFTYALMLSIGNLR